MSNLTLRIVDPHRASFDCKCWFEAIIFSPHPLSVTDVTLHYHISSKSPKPLFGAFGQTEKTGFKVFGSFQPGLPRKVPQSLWKVITNGKANLGVHFPSFRHALEAIWGSFSASFAPKRGFQKPFSPYFLHLQIVKTPSRCKWVANAPGRGFDDLWLYSKCTGKGFSKKICLKFCTMFQNCCDFFWNFVPYFESLWNFWNFIPCFEILWNFCNSIPCFEILWNFIAFFENIVKFLKFCALIWNFVPIFYNFFVIFLCFFL